MIQHLRIPSLVAVSILLTGQLVLYCQKSNQLAQLKFDLLKSGVDPDSDNIAYILNDQFWLDAGNTILVLIAAAILATLLVKSHWGWIVEHSVGWFKIFAGIVVLSGLFVFVWRQFIPLPEWTFS